MSSDRCREKWDDREQRRLLRKEWLNEEFNRVAKLERGLKYWLTLTGVRMHPAMMGIFEEAVVEFSYKGKTVKFPIPRTGATARAKAVIKKLIQEYHSGQAAE